jgi:hypothetical protein
MTKDEAKQQDEAFFRRIGEKASFFDEKNFVQIRIGETLVGFEYDETEELLSVQALIYRFRSEPLDKVLDAVFAEESETNSGGGRLVFNSENFAFYLQKDFEEKIADHLFFDQINRIAESSLIWNSDILTQAAEKANS